MDGVILLFFMFQNKKPDIFNRYNDIEVIKPKRKAMPDETNGHAYQNGHGTSNIQNGHGAQNGQDNLDSQQNGHSNGHPAVTVNVTNGETNGNGTPTSEKIKDKHVPDTNGHGSDDETLEIPAFNLDDDSSDCCDFRECQVSPVPTPVLQRPMTREQTRMSHEDRVSAVIHGNVNRYCSADSKTIKIYLASGFSG